MRVLIVSTEESDPAISKLSGLLAEAGIQVIYRELGKLGAVDPEFSLERACDAQIYWNASKWYLANRGKLVRGVGRPKSVFCAFTGEDMLNILRENAGGVEFQPDLVVTSARTVTADTKLSFRTAFCDRPALAFTPPREDKEDHVGVAVTNFDFRDFSLVARVFRELRHLLPESIPKPPVYGLLSPEVCPVPLRVPEELQVLPVYRGESPWRQGFEDISCYVPAMDIRDIRLGMVPQELRLAAASQVPVLMMAHPVMSQTGIRMLHPACGSLKEFSEHLLARRGLRVPIEDAAAMDTTGDLVDILLRFLR